LTGIFKIKFPWILRIISIFFVLELKVSGPSSGGGVQAEARPPAESHPPSSRRRAKRCTCYTYKDKECVYYCHLDIIWINTPEHTVPYGMSSYQRPVRRRRWAGPGRGRRGEAEPPRCVCWLQTDSSCSSFCMHR
uniref:Endothelin-3 n=1 Tax=Salarias fasciatus TaxID=181472 RepID=A0A672I3N8_SALFA